MKKIILTLTAIFICIIARAETITINWHKDNKTYMNTTCEVGGNVTLPPIAPTRKGYIFKGWLAEHFYRGTYANWGAVPQNINEYSVDVYDNKTPQRGDYIIVKDASEYTGLLVKTHSTGGSNASIDVTVLDTQETYNYLYTKVFSKTRIGDTDFFIRYGSPWEFSADVPMIINNVIYQAGSKYSWTYDRFVSFFAKEANTNTVGRYTGSWKFVYHGDWENGGVAGWKPVEQVEE